MNFLLNTRLGQLLILVAAIGLAWWRFSTHYYNAGYEARTAVYATKQAKANVDLVARERARDATSSQISKQTDQTAAAAVADTQAATAAAKEVIHVVYRDRPITKPVAPGSCVHPVDGRVQERIDRAVDQANRAGSSL